MLVHCPTCKESMNAKLNVSTNCVICDKCDSVIDNISSFSKNAMKSNGDIIRVKTGKSFGFKCITCGLVETAAFVNKKIVGKDCKTKNKCKFNISKIMENTIKMYAEQAPEISPDDDTDSGSGESE